MYSSGKNVFKGSVSFREMHPPRKGILQGDVSSRKSCIPDSYHSGRKLKWFGIAFLNLFNIQLALNEWLVELELNFGPIKDPVPAVSIPSQRRQFLHPDALQHLASGDLLGFSLVFMIMRVKR